MQLSCNLQRIEHFATICTVLCVDFANPWPLILTVMYTNYN